MIEQPADLETLARDVRIYVFDQAAATARIPQAPAISRALERRESDVRAALHHLAAGRVLMLAPNDGNIWVAAPFCAVPSAFRVNTAGRRYWAICIWDALGVAAALGTDAEITTPCGDCGAGMT